MTETKLTTLAQAVQDLPSEFIHTVGCDSQGRDEAWRIKGADGILIAEFRSKAAYEFFCLAVEEAKKG